MLIKIHRCLCRDILRSKTIIAPSKGDGDHEGENIQPLSREAFPTNENNDTPGENPEALDSRLIADW